MYDFEDIRPYHDDEVRPVVDALVRDRDFLGAMAKFKSPKLYARFPGLARKAVAMVLKRETAPVRTINDVQVIIEKYLDKLIEATTTSLTHDGLDALDPDAPYLFISNHRDITLDPALVNYMLYHNGFDTVQIAIGDNLMKRPFLNDLMRLNKSFLVKRGLQGRELLKASRQLSAYIHYCIREQRQNVWIAQREGRAKDGIDKTEVGIIKMLQLADREKDKSIPLKDTINALRIVPVAISYELDPCDIYKAEELMAVESSGKFEKDENSDIRSILSGMIGEKGAIHVSFGTPLSIEDDVTVDVVAGLIDAQIIKNYRLHPTNYFAVEKIRAGSDKQLDLDKVLRLDSAEIRRRREMFEDRLASYPESLRPYVLSMYANPAIVKHE